MDSNQADLPDLSKKENIIKLTAARLLQKSQENKSNNYLKDLEKNKVIKALNTLEDGDAALYIKLFKNKFCYDNSSGEWFYWNDHHWRIDKLNNTIMGFDDIIEIYFNERERQYEELEKAHQRQQTERIETYKSYIKILTGRIKLLHRLYYKKTILELAKSGVNSLGIVGDNWDAKPYKLSVKNGCIDLKTGELKNGDPKDLLSICSPVEWKGINEQCRNWIDFLYSTFDFDQEKVDFLQRLLGYSLLGTSKEKIFPVFWGEHGDNGKTTILEIMKKVLNEFAIATPQDFLIQAKFKGGNAGAPDATMKALRGARLVWCSETNEGDKIDSSRLKSLTGGDSITTRAPFDKRNTTFEPTHLMLMITNSKPRMLANDSAIWSRVLLISFDLSFVREPKFEYERKADVTLKTKLNQELSGILAWLVRGAITYQKEGLMIPENIKMATSEYRKDEDSLRDFIFEELEIELTALIKRSDLYKIYSNWCNRNGEVVKTRRYFLNDIKRRFPDIKTIRGIKYICGVREKEYL